MSAISIKSPIISVHSLDSGHLAELFVTGFSYIKVEAQDFRRHVCKIDAMTVEDIMLLYMMNGV